MPIRNPLIGLIDTSKKTPVHPGIAGVEEHDPTHSDPTMEHYAGDNNAWRGTEMHGVATKEHAEAYDHGSANAENAPVVSYTHIPEPKEAIDVRVVNEYAHEERTFRGIQFPVGPVAQQIVGAHPKRSRVTIKNIAQSSVSSGTLPSNIFLANLAGTNTGNGGTINLPITNWTDLMVTYTISALVLGAATDVRMRLQQTTDGVNWVDVPGSEVTFTAPGTQTAFLHGPVSSRVRLAWTVTAGPLTSMTGLANAIVFPIDVSDTVTGNEVWIGHDQTVSSFTSYRLDPGSEITLTTERAIYAIASPNEQSLLQLIDEFSVEIP